jgi:S1-C subfamily serine protease
MQMAGILFAMWASSVSVRAQDLEEAEEMAIRAAVAAVAPTVVKIETIGGLEVVGKVLVATGPTTGLVVSEEGHIVSSAFNFVQQPSSILVTLPGGRRAAAEIVARDHSRMLVLLKVTTDEKLAIPVAVPRGEMVVGQWAIAVGRTYDSPEPSLSVGVLSALNRVWGRAIQTDAKISPANYGGPLVDIRGRVLGVLVPLSPQGQGSEIAGAEWYNSGIGFAVPLDEVYARLDALKSGQDLHPGLLGISLKAGDIYSLPAEIAASQPGSPAYKAGLKSGDTIVEIDGQPIVRQSQLKHAMGARYAKDRVKLVVKRGEERISKEIELIDKLDPYAHPFLGILPMRGDTATGVAVRYVYPRGPASDAGILIGDRITALDGEAMADAAALRLAVANLEPKAEAALTVVRGTETLALKVKPGKLPTDIPGDLTVAIAEPPPPPAEAPTTGLIEIKLPEETSTSVAYVPTNYHPAIPHGLLVVVPQPGALDRAAFEARWKPVCEEFGLIALAPISAKPDKWEPTEAPFIRKSLDSVSEQFTIDPTRIATYGYQSGGGMAWLMGLSNLDRVRAICPIDALPPARTAAPQNDPVNRLAVFWGVAEKSPSAAATKGLIDRLNAAQIPVTQVPLGEQPRDLSPSEILELGRWHDALDRI